jgi:hypothetical protein
VFGPEVLKDAKRQVQMITENLKIAQSRQKSYADKRRRDLSFEVADFVYLKGITHERHQKVQGQRKTGPKICRSLPDSGSQGRSGLSNVHDVFHLSQLKKCLQVPEEQIPMEQLDLGGDLS